jgi:hypothetical protein
MRCEEVIEELAAPTDTRDAAALAEHLSRCPSCAACAKRAAELDRLWQATAPAEPATRVWDNLWASVAVSLETLATKEVTSPTLFVSSNGSANGSVARPEPKPVHRPLPHSVRSRLWTAIGVVGLAQAAAVLLVAGLTWRFFVPAYTPERAEIASARPLPAVPPATNVVRGSLPDVDIEEGHLVVILADPKNPTVVDRTPKVKVTLDGEDYLYVNLDLDWFATYNRVESLGKPDVAMKE